MVIQTWLSSKPNQSSFGHFRPPAARVSGVVEESPGTLEYEVALFREAAKGDEQSDNEVPVDQAVAIGTKLQLRATINSQQSGKLQKSLFPFEYRNVIYK